MKVLHLAGGGDIGGAKTHIHSLINELSKYIDVKIVSLRPGVFADEARDMGIQVQVVRTGSFISDVLQVVKIIKKGKYDILHSHGAKANAIAVFAKFFTGILTITTVHSDYRLDYMHSVYKKISFGNINTVALRFIDFYTGVSKNFKEMLIQRNFKPNKIFTVYNGIDFNVPAKEYDRAAFLKKYNLDLKPTDIAVGILARLHPVKGIDTFIKAAREVVAQNPSVKFVIGGDGEERKSLEKIAANLGIEENILFAGWIDDPNEFLTFMDINVMTSLSESFPYTILEGTRLKKATISTNVGGIPDLIDNGENGYLFQPGDYAKLAEELLDLVNHPQKRLEMGEKIYQKVKKFFSIASMCKSQLDIYNHILFRAKDPYRYDVIISGYYGFHNSGDDAILMSIIDNLKIRKENIRIMVLSKKPKETKKSYMVDSVNRLNPFKIITALRKTRLFINGGGNLMQDDTSTRSLIYYLCTIWLAKKLGTKVMVYANGIGPIHKNFNRKLTQRVLNKVNIITLREELSQQELERLNINKPEIIVTADPALTVEAVKGSEIDKIFHAEGIPLEGSYVGFSARICENNLKYDESVIARIADYMAETYNVKPVFIPMQPNDLSIIECIVSQMKNKAYIIRNNYDVKYTIGVISRMEMLIGMRLHSLIYAASLGIPVIGLVYDTKVEAFLQYFRQTSAGHVNKLEFDKLASLVNQVWKNRAIIKNRLEKVTIELKEKAFENSKIALELLESKERR